MPGTNKSARTERPETTKPTTARAKAKAKARAKVQLSRTQFRKYLESLPEGYYVGRTYDCLSCPLTKYLNSIHEARGSRELAIVDANTYSVKDVENRLLPRWAKLFVSLVDRSYPVNEEGFRVGYRNGAFITRELALAALDKVDNLEKGTNKGGERNNG
jgi:hypothetical protein